MVQSNAIVDMAIFEGDNTIEIVRLRHNKKNNQLEYKNRGVFTAWHPIDESKLNMDILPEKYLIENGVKTRIRALRINQDIKGNKCAIDTNPRLMQQLENLRMDNARLQRLSRHYYETLVNMMGKDKFEEMMKNYFKAVATAKSEGSTYSDFNSPYFRPYSGSLGISRPGGI